MQKLTAEQYAELTRGAKVLTRDKFGDKVLHRDDGLVLKLFRRKRLLSSALLWPYAVRFADAATKLDQLGIGSVTVTGVYHVPAIERHVVTYPFVTGQTLRDVLTDPATSASRRTQLILALAEFVALLHGKGVYFRAIHFGNVLVLPDGTLSLIDVLETSFHRRPLRLGRRTRNFRPMTHYQEDLQALLDCGAAQFLSVYLQHARLSPSQCHTFAKSLEKNCPQLAAAVRPGLIIASGRPQKAA